MKKLLVVLLLFGCSLWAFGQATNENVLVTSSHSVVQDSVMLEWIVGDNLTDTQVLFGIEKSAITAPALQNNAWIVSPVITQDVISVISSDVDPGKFWVKVCDNTSRTLIQTLWTSNPMEIDLSDLATGTYIVVICNAKDATFARVKVIKE